MAAACTAISAAHAADTIDNPKYLVWSNFKEGSSSTVSADVQSEQKNMHIDVAKTLKSVAADQVVVETVVTTNGKAAAPTTETIAAKTLDDSIKIAGNRQILAMGKTFQCKVWDVTGNSSNSSHAGMAPQVNGTKAIIYVCPDVPGGVVELDSVNQNGKQINFVLTAMEAK